MQPGGFGGPGNGQPPDGYPPGYPGGPAQPGAQPQQPSYGGPPQSPQVSPHPGAAHGGHGAPPQQYGAPPQQYGAPPQQYGAPPQQYGAPPQQYGAPPQQYGAPPQQYGAPGMPPGSPGAYGAPPGIAMGAPLASSFGQAQSALAGAGGMMKAMKYGFIALGGICVLTGIVLIFAVDAITGISIAFTGGVLVVVALLVLPRFSGMLGQATAMVDGFAAKEQLAQTGIPAMGRLLSVQQTGRLVNYNPEIQAVVEVHHPQLGPYQTQTTAIVPQIAIPRAQPGASVQVRVSPQNQHEIALIF